MTTNRVNPPKFIRALAAAMAVACPCVTLIAHDQPLHKLMSHAAAISSGSIGNLGRFARDNLADDDSWITTKFTYNSASHDAITWIENGSWDEDDGNFGADTRHHFYAPVVPPRHSAFDPHAL